MKKSYRIYLFICIASFCIAFNSCKKDEELFDLYPLKVGNKFSYTLTDRFDKRLFGHYTQGTQKWTIISVTQYAKTNSYTIERKLNGIYVNWSDINWNNRICDTTIIKDSINYFSINENRSNSVLSFWDISFPRYQSIPDTIIHWSGYNQDNNAAYHFSAGLGLIAYYYSEGLMISQTRVSLVLDSSKIIK
jgi:hypothetical protein